VIFFEEKSTVSFEHRKMARRFLKTLRDTQICLKGVFDFEKSKKANKQNSRKKTTGKQHRKTQWENLIFKQKQHYQKAFIHNQ